MRGFKYHIGSPSMALVTEHVGLLTRFMTAVRRLRKRVRQIMCVAIHGRHELYRARTATRLFQQCLLCGYETTGWTIDRRDHRLHLVANSDCKISHG